MAGETVTLPPEVQEALTRLKKLEQDYETAQRGNAGLAAKLRAWERLKDELGDVLEMDANGMPVRLKVDNTPVPVPTFTGGHPLAPFSTYAGEGWKPETVDAYYQQLWAQKGYLTKQEAQQYADSKATQAFQMAVGTAKVWRTVDKLIAQKDYADLANQDSELSKRTARILQERRMAAPFEGARGFDEWQYGDLGHLQFGADMARIELAKEAAVQAASTAAAVQAQGAGNLSPAPASTGGGMAPGTKPDLASNVSGNGEVSDALAEALVSVPRA